MSECSASALCQRTLDESLKSLYRELEREIAKYPVRCASCGRCCRFADFGHALYLSNIEARCLLSGAPAPRADTRQSDASKVCPFLHGPRCAVHDRRALGCRTFFCDKAHRDDLQSLHETYLRKLKTLARTAGMEWRYAALSDQIAGGSREASGASRK